MLREERLRVIIQRLVQNQSVICNDLAQEFGLNVATIRLDLLELERRGLAKRVYGGAVLSEGQQTSDALTVVESQIMERFGHHQIEKEAIGHAAAEMIADGETIIIDAGSTAFQVCKNLSGKRNLTIISCALNNLWQELAWKPGLQIFLTGGFLRAESLSFVGDYAENMLRGFRASKVFMGIDGISLEHGFTTLNFLEAAIKKRIIEVSEEVIVVADHSKFGKIGLIPVVPIETVHKIVTDSGVSPDFVADLQKRGVEVIVADIESPAKGEHIQLNQKVSRP